MNVPIMSEVFNNGHKPQYLYWVGCAGAFDRRYSKVAKAFAKILNFLNVDYAVLGTEEICNGDPARRAGNEMLFQMQALQLIGIFEKYEIKNILCICPHCFNTFKNEYPDLGGNYNVQHYTQFIKDQIEINKLTAIKDKFHNQRITFHDPCYLGRANDEYEAPRFILEYMGFEIIEMRRCKSFALCCGAGGAQMFKEAEKGNKEIFIERTEEALETQVSIIATSCPFCMTMITDGLKYKNKEEEVKNLDIAELIAEAIN